MIKPFTANLPAFQQASNEHGHNSKASQTSSLGDLLNPKAADKPLEFNGLQGRRDSFALFNAVLEKAYQRIAFNPSSVDVKQPANATQQTDLAGYQQVDKISPQQASDRILSFISSKINSDRAGGADNNALLERLDQGLEGFIKGFNEAKKQIEGMGLLTSELAGEIGKTYQNVNNGIEQLRDEINGVNREVASTGASQKVQTQGQALRSQSFSLNLTTHEGDSVSIQINRASKSSFTTTSENNLLNSQGSINLQSSRSSNFALTVDGDLNEGELTAINQLLEDVDSIANDFFSGDLEQAFEQALSLEIDRDELKSLNLQLQKTTTTKALAAYETHSSLVDDSNQQNISPVVKLNDLLDNIQAILDKANKFAEPIRLLQDIAEGIDEQYLEQVTAQKPQTLTSSLGQLIDKFKLN